MALINVKVAKITDEAKGIRSFVLAKKGLFKLPKYTPGSHIDVHCGEGIIRQYSLCGDPNDRRKLMIAVNHGDPSRGGSELMHEAVQEGDNLEIGSPRNNFLLDETLSHAILIAGGIGITPIIAMADKLHSLGTSFELHYFTRGSEFTAFENRLKNGTYSKRVYFHQGLSIDDTQAKFHEILDNPNKPDQVYICGPDAFMNSAESIALKNRNANAVKLERFAANPALTGAPTKAFDLTLSRTGITLKVEADETILDVLEENNIDVAFSCEQGVCGTCVSEVVEGSIDHRDSFLSDKQKETNSLMCICVSREANDKLVLKL